MKGIYVVDLVDQRFFVCCANDIKDALNAIPPDIVYDYSYHYYPLLENETEEEGEFRIYKKMVINYQLPNVLSRTKTLSRIASGSWTPSLSRLNNMSDVDLSITSEQKQSPDVFSLSL